MSITNARASRTRLLDEIWEFAWLGEDVDLSQSAVEAGTPLADANYVGRIAIPGCFDTLPGLAGSRGTAALRTRFTTGDEPAGSLTFDGLGVWAAVYVDAALLTVHRKPYSRFSVEVPPSASTGTAERELIVLVDNRFDTDRSPLQENYFDFYAYGGIFRPVAYTPLPAVHVRDVTVATTELDPPTISVSVELNTDTNVALRYIVDGAEVSTTDTVDATAVTAPHLIPLPGAALWSPESPTLHTLVVEATAGSSRDSYAVTFGLRTVAVRGSEILLNGKPVRLFGWNRHESHPQFGPALPVQQMVQDIGLMKAAGANFVRGSHYPQDDRFLDLCDEMGVLVWEESIGWQQDERHFSNADYQSLVGEQQAEMIRAHINHPSIIMWGFQNELHSELESARDVIGNLASISRKTDASRPVTFATCRFPHDRCLDLVDIVSVNTYPGWYAADEEEYRPLHEIAERIESVQAELTNQGLAEKPLILSEIGAGAIYGWRDAHAGHWSEQYQTDYLSEVCRQFLAKRGIAGLALWQFCDGRTYGSPRANRRPRSFNNKGILDEYRRPKQAYAEIARLMREASDT